ncbi:MAG: helix-turn-helix transcriptional regulator [bacterium]
MKCQKSNILTRFGQTVRKRRMEMDLSQETLAERADLHRTYIADIERGVRNVSLKNIGKLARALDLTVSKLCTGIEKDGRR